MKWIKGHRLWLIGGLLGYAVLALAFSALQGIAGGSGVVYGQSLAAVFNKPTNSSPIALSNPVSVGGPSLVWVVNPDDDSVSVIRTDTNAVIKKINVGDEPQSIALDPNNQFAYVANAAGNSVTVIQIANANPAAFNASVEKELITGAEPWNIVISPDGKRVFVANSAQDTITVIKTDAPNARTILGNVELRNSLCNVGDPNRRFQPRGLAVSQDNTRLFVTRFLSFTTNGGVQADDNGKEGVVCRLNINTGATNISGYTPAAAIKLAPRETGFLAQIGNPPVDTPTSAFPNQLQSIVLRGASAYLPNIAASPKGPLKFNVDTQAFVNRIDAINGSETDGGVINLHLGARDPEPGKTKLFFANPWAIAFTNQSGAGNAYVVSAGSDLLVKVNVDPAGVLANTVDANTTRYIDLNDPANPATSGANAGKNPLGIVITDDGSTAYTMNNVSRNVSVVNLTNDSVTTVIKTTDLPPPNTFDEMVHVGKEVFFSSRGVFDGGKVNRLSSEGWQNCASCHFNGWTDGVIWIFETGPRKSVPLAGTFNPHNQDDQRILNYTAPRDETQDFELNIRNISGPGFLNPPTNTLFDPNHGLIISDTGDINAAPAVINNFALPNTGRKQVTVTLPGSSTPWPALDAMNEWIRVGVRTPNGALTTAELTAGGGNAAGGLNPADIEAGRALFFRAGCQSCHGGGKWSNSVKDFVSPPAAAEISTEKDLNGPNNPPDPNGAQYLKRFLTDIKSFNLNVPGVNPLNQIPGQPLIGGIEKDTANRDAAGFDHDGDGVGNGYNLPSLLGMNIMPPYYHNGACETLACVLANPVHRAAGLRQGQPDLLTSADAQAKVVRFLEALDADTAPAANLYVRRHDLFFDPAKLITGTTVDVGANVSLLGPRVPTFTPGPLKVTFFDGRPGQAGTTEIGSADLAGIALDNGQVSLKVPFNVPNQVGARIICVTVDSSDLFVEDNERDNTACRRVAVSPPPPDRTRPEVSNVRINNDAVTNSTDVKVTFNAIDPTSPGGAQTSGLDSFCAVSYIYSSAQKRWIEQDCNFRQLPAPNGDGSFTVDAKLPSRAGVTYVFISVKDKAGNISRREFDFINFIPAGDIELRPNETRVFRIQLDAGKTAQFTFTPSVGDVDVSAFKDLANLTRCAVSAQNGTAPETVALGAGDCAGATSFQIEVRAVVNSRFSISFTQTAAGLQSAAPSVVAPNKAVPTDPIVAGPPAALAATDDLREVLIPLIRR